MSFRTAVAKRQNFPLHFAFLIKSSFEDITNKMYIFQENEWVKVSKSHKFSIE